MGRPTHKCSQSHELVAVLISLLIPSFPYTDIMSISSRILKLLSKVATRLNCFGTKSAGPTAASPQSRLPSILSNPITTHATSSYGQRSQRRFVSLASGTTRGWRIPRDVHRRSPERHDRHSIHCLAAGILFSAIQLGPRAKQGARKAWSCNIRPTRSCLPKKQASEIPKSDVPIIVSRQDQLSSHPATAGEIRGKAVLNDHTHINEDLARGCKGDVDDWAGDYPVTEGWISMKPIIGRA